MLYMVIERNKPGAAGEIYRRVREHGRLLPAGLEYVDSWVEPDLSRCFQLMRTEDAQLFDQWIAVWSDLVDFDVIPVVSSAEASRRAGAAHG